MLEKVPAAIGHALQGVRPGREKLVWASDAAQATESIVLTSPAFDEGGAIAARYTEDGETISPPLGWNGAPAGAAELLLVVEDADSPTPKPILHLIAAKLPAADAALEEGDLAGPSERARLGKNSFGKTGWLPPDPPTGHGPHRYVFQLYALEQAFDWPNEPGKGDVEKALAGGVLARGLLVGTYERPG